MSETTVDWKQQLQDLNDRIRRANYIPTWEDAEAIVGKSEMDYEPHIWRWQETLDLLSEAGELLTPQRGAERRSIDHVNPTLPRESLSTTHALGSAIQLVRPGELAPAHRHTASAIRFVLEGGDERIRTTVNGEQLPMENGDLLLTPRMGWHDHINESDRDILWFDALDYPMVNYFRAARFQLHDDDHQGEALPLGHSIDHNSAVRPAFTTDTHVVPVRRYPWSEVRDRLDSMQTRAADPHHAYTVTYAPPRGGAGTLPTFGCFVQHLPAGFTTAAYQETASRAVVVTAGSGTSRIAGREFDWTKGDVISIPPNASIEHQTGTKSSTMFYVSERPLLQQLGIWSGVKTADQR